MQIKKFNCPICGYEFLDEEGAKRCENMCNSMIDAYMQANKITRKEATERFLMEVL